MTRRRRAAVSSLVVLGATVVPATAATATPTTAAAATPTTALAATARAVALQVKYPNGSVQTWCVPYRAGMTGADVLAVATPTYGTGPYAGFVLKITGKGTVPPTSSRYWAYWRSPTGKATDYTYSGSGVTSTQPPLRSVETWVWTTSPDTNFPKRSFASLCPSGA